MAHGFRLSNFNKFLPSCLTLKARIEYQSMLSRKYLLKSSIRVARFARVLAKAIDIFIVLICCVAMYPWGVLLGAGYMAICDSIQQGQSVGKKFIGFSVVSLHDGSSCSLKQSVVRNLPFTVPLLFAIFPIWGWIFSAILGTALVLLEIWLLFKIESGNRLGDVMADTTVINSDIEALPSNKQQSWFESSSNVTC